MIALANGNNLMGYASLNAYPEIDHFVTTRKAAIDLHSVIIPQQTHHCVSVCIDELFLNSDLATQQEMLKGVDALITNLPGSFICVKTADCVPILLYDKRQQAVAAIHAGWRGTVGKIVAKTMDHMRQTFGTEGKDVIACIGPSISLDSFEVGDEVYGAFAEEGFDMSLISNRNAETNKYHIDLWEANRIELLNEGVPASQIEEAGVCSYVHYDQFFSARRLGIACGRTLSGIKIRQ